jgi:hypothetical protein
MPEAVYFHHVGLQQQQQQQPRSPPLPRLLHPIAFLPVSASTGAHFHPPPNYLQKHQEVMVARSKVGCRPFRPPAAAAADQTPSAATSLRRSQTNASDFSALRNRTRLQQHHHHHHYQQHPMAGLLQHTSTPSGRRSSWLPRPRC